jgi:hypothetical protein
MAYTSVLPAIQIMISIGAALVYGYAGDWKHFTYWAAAAILTTSVTIL